MSDNVTVSGGGIGFCGLLAVLFIGLKLTGFIAWSWWWVISPLWIPLCIAIIITLIALIFIAIATSTQ